MGKGEKTNKVCAIIQARMSSTRLRGKTMMKIGRKTVLGYVVDRIKAINFLSQTFGNQKFIDEIIVATPYGKEEQPIITWCKKNKVNHYHNKTIKNNDLLSRYYHCAKKYNVDVILRISGDCPLLDPLMAYALLKDYYLFPKPYDALAVNEGRMPFGYDVELFEFELLETVYPISNKREHVSQALRKDEQDRLDFGLQTPCFQNIKLDLDTRLDYERIKNYAKYL